MEILPILRTLRRNRVGALLIALQIALTLAITSNGLSIIQQRLRWMQRQTGIDEANIFTLQNAWEGDRRDLKSRIEGDLEALRALPGVIDAEATNSVPLGGDELHWPLGTMPDQQNLTAWSAVYYVDDHGLAAFGLNLVAGRWFTAAEVGEVRNHETKIPPAIVVTENIAKALFPTGDALGKVIYFLPRGSSRIVGVVERMQRPADALGGSPWGNPWAQYSIFAPFQYLNNGLIYVVHTKPGQQGAMLRAAPAKLRELTRRRVIQEVQPYSQIRRQAYRHHRSIVIMLSVLSALLLTITAFGVVGLTMYWVGQRRRYIGMRRALGARRLDILRYFHTENLLIAGTGCIFGVAGGLCGDIWLVSSLELARMSAAYICTGALIVLGLCQAAVVWPALRASFVPPAIAARGL
ncbi:MAG: FtsX-like permease family protein [Steroidobacteraceae bacterium]